MADEADVANDHAEFMLSVNLSAERRKHSSLIAIGACYQCGEKAVHAFCSTDCRDDYDHAARLRRIQGNV